MYSSLSSLLKTFIPSFFLHILVTEEILFSNLSLSSGFCIYFWLFHVLLLENSCRMSCNGCRILRKGCSEDCMLRHCLQFIDNPQAQANATVFVAKFFGRAGLMSFISSVPYNQRPSLFQSLLYEAVGRAVNPVSGAVGLLWTGNWHVCQKAVMTVLRGGTVEPLQELFEDGMILGPAFDNSSECASFRPRDNMCSGSKKTTTLKRKMSDDDNDDGAKRGKLTDLDLRLMHSTVEKRRAATPSSEESETTTLGSGSRSTNCSLQGGGERKLLTLFF
ncbi:LOB domain-containing protein 39 [Ricinus communis]|uniref:LOB domain-containing protein 39 n=1 Tax=Ricinus communis TaxID=3988 RepID=UPI00201A389A|nr:LOB domain-containing protein 39 [Ricinus communis]